MQPVASRRQYKHSLTVRGHNDAIVSLAISTDGKLLASAGRAVSRSFLAMKSDTGFEGVDWVRLWDIASGGQLSTPEHGHVLRGPPSCTLWVKRRDDPRNI